MGVARTTNVYWTFATTLAPTRPSLRDGHLLAFRGGGREDQRSRFRSRYIRCIARDAAVQRSLLAILSIGVREKLDDGVVETVRRKFGAIGSRLQKASRPARA